MDYSKQLLSFEWKRKRDEILERDNYKCQRCLMPYSSFIGISKAFGIISFQEIKKNGIISEIDYKNETITFLYDKYCVQAKYWKIQKNFPFIPDFLDFVMQNKRNSIDFFCVPRNSIKEKDLTPEMHVHHKYYVKGNKPWEYDNKVLLTLCQSCHKLEHMNNSIKIYNTSKEILESNKCCSCQGLGYIEKNNCEEICFTCQGFGFDLK